MYAVEIYHDKHKLGYIPRTDNKQIAKLLSTGNDCFETRIQWVDGETHPENQLGAIVYVVEKK